MEFLQGRGRVSYSLEASDLEAQKFKELSFYSKVDLL